MQSGITYVHHRETWRITQQECRKWTADYLRARPELSIAFLLEDKKDIVLDFGLSDPPALRNDKIGHCRASFGVRSVAYESMLLHLTLEICSGTASLLSGFICYSPLNYHWPYSNLSKSSMEFPNAMFPKRAPTTLYGGCASPISAGARHLRAEDAARDDSSQGVDFQDALEGLHGQP